MNVSEKLRHSLRVGDPVRSVSSTGRYLRYLGRIESISGKTIRTSLGIKSTLDLVTLGISHLKPRVDHDPQYNAKEIKEFTKRQRTLIEHPW
jgi:hypothetical protein